MISKPPTLIPPKGVRLNAWVFSDEELAMILDKLAASLGLAGAEAELVLDIVDHWGGLRRYQEDVYTDRPLDGWQRLCQHASAAASTLDHEKELRDAQRDISHLGSSTPTAANS